MSPLLRYLPLLPLLAGCTSRVPPALELALHDQPVTCVEGAARCTIAGQAVAGEEHRVRVRLGRSSRATRSDPGLHLVAQLLRPGGDRAVLQLDLPPRNAAEGPVVLYSETDRTGRLLFKTSQAAGRVEISRDPGCPCQTGRLELLFTDAGPDGVVGSADDQVRRLTRARLRRDDRPFCHRRDSLTLRQGLLVVGHRDCPVARGGGGGAGSSCAWSSGGGVAIEWNDGWYDESWTGDWTEEEWLAGGPEESWNEAWPEDQWTDPWSSDWDGGANGESWTGDWSDDWTDDWSDDGWSDDGWFDDGWSDDGWSDGGWSDGGWSDDDWGDDSGDEDWGDDWWQ